MPNIHGLKTRSGRRQRSWQACFLGLALWAVCLGQTSGVGAQAPATQSYTAAQADRGQLLYVEHCESCHGKNMDDGEAGPPLKGADFRVKWGLKSAEALFAQMSARMPPARPGTLGDQAYVELIALMLRENGVGGGSKELSSDAEVLKTVSLPAGPRPGGGGLAPGAIVPPGPVRINPLDQFRAVTDALLKSVPDGEWLTWRRTYDAYGFSPLTQINKANVRNLRVAWSWSLPNGPNESTPLVHDGVLFVHGYGDYLEALDAATGDLLWRYSRRLPKGIAPTVKRALGLYGNLVYLPTSDTHIVALDVKSGKVVWDHAVADFAAGYRMTGGPLVVKGKVLIGTSGRAPGGNYVVALEADSGQEAWRFHSIVPPGEPGGNTWNGLPLEKRNGASVWIPGSYDVERNLALFGPGNTYDTGPLRDLTNEPGQTNDGFYNDSTLALNPDTGKLAWFFQHQANDQWDLDWAFERQTMQLPVNGTMTNVIVTGGKQMIFDILEAGTGRYLSSIDLGLQNGVIEINPKSGEKLVDLTLIPGDGETKMICPHVSGGRGWMPTSYDAAARILYVPMVDACMDLVPVPKGERGSLSTGVRWTVRPRPESDGKYGRLQAINLETKKTVWIERHRAPVTTGVLATAGGLVFAGSLDRMFSAYDSSTGEPLWQTRLNDVPSSSPISYAVNGRQYVAMVVGPGGYQSTSYGMLVPELQNPPDHGAAIWVFEVLQEPR